MELFPWVHKNRQGVHGVDEEEEDTGLPLINDKNNDTAPDQPITGQHPDADHNLKNKLIQQIISLEVPVYPVELFRLPD